MKFKYCPECGSIQLSSYSNELKCKKCSYTGKMKEDSIDVINAFVTSKKSHTVTANANNSVQSNNLVIQQEQKTNSLKERLKKFENSDVEIL